MGVGALIIAALLAAFFDILLLGNDKDVQFIYMDEQGRILERGPTADDTIDDLPWGF